MWIVKVALQRPYTFIVLAILIVLLGIFTLTRTPTDIFPNIRIPVVASIWGYGGLPPDEMSNRLVLFTERVAQTTVNDVEHTESQSLNGIAVVKYFFQPGKASYETGRGDFLNWLDAEKKVLEGYKTYYDLKAEQGRIMATIEKYTGKELIK